MTAMLTIPEAADQLLAGSPVPSPILQFLALLLFASTLIGSCALLLAALEPRFRQWPQFWAAQLGMCLLIPILAMALSHLPEANPLRYFPPTYLQGPLDALGALDRSILTTPAAPLRSASTWPALLLALTSIYLIGATLLVLRLLAGRRKVAAIAAGARPIKRDGLPGFKVAEFDGMPFAYTSLGGRRQQIVVPVRFLHHLSHAQLADVLRHEQAHLEAGDDRCGLMLRLLLCVCWISPFAHLLFARWLDSIEVRCDLAVTRGRSKEMRRAYAETLLQALHIAAGRVSPYPAASFSRHQLRSDYMRIKHILAGHVPAFKGLRHTLLLGAASLSLTAMGAALFATRVDAGPAQDTKHAETAGTMLDGRLTASFGETLNPLRRSEVIMHNGVDIAAPTGTAIHAPADGTVVIATDRYKDGDAYGKVVVVETADNVQTLFAHLQDYQVSAGQRISAGTRIASVGMTGKSTGPHVHIETFKSGERVDPASIWPLNK